ncbi:HNH endonuclease signature motif containing protein [Pseudomonas abietaniphila]|uniref:HNH endonuclease n=1 Tax=Pseudomonas abietaniphila TaxID=89065 RepID=A0A1G8TCE0_9PSED|nr:HNH endonuclease signature motif containing protein [Pseudomonas abietaniphila]SDJ39064.1 HNH endonuclease [Pseudomonas abietaniphila]
MQCSVENCEREASYKAAKLCKMHYFRVRRNGTVVKTPIGRALRYVTPNGYITLYKPGHPLANKTNCVFEHRFVMWPIVGPECRPCELCGLPQTWATCHVDHIDDDRQNNTASNLRILCRGCNVKRGFRPESHEFRSSVGLIEFEGRRDTATAWARDPRVNVSGKTILFRKAAGASDFEALFGDKVTHNGRKPIPPPRKTNHKYERSNAVAITIEGHTMTAAEWHREPGVTVSVRSIVNRIREGIDPIDAVFARPGKKPIADDDLKALTALYRAKTKELKGRAA